jgi:hypothetical protein
MRRIHIVLTLGMFAILPLLCSRSAIAGAETLTIARSQNGSLTATMTGNGELGAAPVGNCMVNRREIRSCFDFHADGAHGAATIVAPSSCEIDRDEALCSAVGATSLRLAQATAGRIAINSEAVGTKRCSPVPVYVDGGTLGTKVDIRDGCIETVRCTDPGAGTMTVDPQDVIDKTCATAVLGKFYHWYSVQPNHRWTDHFNQVKSLFDPTLYSMLLAVLNSTANQREPVLDFDPFVNAQWDAKSYAFGKPSATGRDVSIPVTLNLSGRPEATTKLTAVMRSEAPGGYVIHNIVYDPKFNLREFLSKELRR